ncbi:serine O-acetyltransferase [Monoraphidium neglectum]|uniref:serine O-acetyltransferase n=1 Tax=Monoraphidium neglectum TaxID=145388 RepID=A0A0D2N477_9CHLO|nr:serine O-acetyltransferase [Monoraphidium neglectum]KIZ00881.1 serine O-acetyltransferase [Monoraphidium neglectum]|eukprot:XP_013899900.1 serine O-acetyltransferase [Monoraphidium neglectum]
MCLIQHAAAAFSNPPGSGEGAPAASIIDWNFPQDPTALGAAASDEYPGGREGAASGPGSLGADSAEEFERAVWGQIRAEASHDAAHEPVLSSFLYASILAHPSFERALAFVLSNRLANSVLLPTQLLEIFHDVLASEAGVKQAALADVEACYERDPACRGYSQALLYYKGYHALQTQRIAHALWNRGQQVMARLLHSRISEVLSIDIHPAAVLGRGILLDHGTGVVIGETAVIGDNVSIGQNVTLGGTGKEDGDRHPKISDDVLIGANVTVLGNIPVGQGAQVAAGSLVLKPVPPHTLVAGSPAKPVGKISGKPALGMIWNGRFNANNPDPDGEAAPSEKGDAASSSSNGNGTAPPAAVGPRAPVRVNGSGKGAGSGNGSSRVAVLAGGTGWAQAALVNGGAGGSGSDSDGKATPAAAAAPPLPPLPPPRPDITPAPLRGVHEGEVQATMDDATAARQWPAQGAEDPEFVI